MNLPPGGALPFGDNALPLAPPNTKSSCTGSNLSNLTNLPSLMQRVKCLGRVAVDATEGRVCRWTGVVGTAAAARRARGYVMSLPMTPLVGTGPRLGAARAARVALSSYAGEWFSEIVVRLA